MGSGVIVYTILKVAVFGGVTIGITTAIGWFHSFTLKGKSSKGGSANDSTIESLHKESKFSR